LQNRSASLIITRLFGYVNGCVRAFNSTSSGKFDIGQLLPMQSLNPKGVA
jgi:hypothetical protein